jgi:hypothetical protein
MSGVPAQPQWRARTQRVLLTRVKRESLGNTKRSRGAHRRLFTLHGASLKGM